MRHNMYEDEDWAKLLGRVPTKIVGCTEGSGDMQIVFEDGSSLRLWHEQDCCEYVEIEEVCGDVEDLLNSPLLMAEVVENAAAPEEYHDREWNGSRTWTFYKFATIKGSVTLRWLGQSNGYYSEEVSACLQEKD